MKELVILRQKPKVTQGPHGPRQPGIHYLDQVSNCHLFGLTVPADIQGCDWLVAITPKLGYWGDLCIHWESIFHVGALWLDNMVPYEGPWSPSSRIEAMKNGHN